MATGEPESVTASDRTVEVVSVRDAGLWRRAWSRTGRGRTTLVGCWRRPQRWEPRIGGVMAAPRNDGPGLATGI